VIGSKPVARCGRRIDRLDGARRDRVEATAADSSEMTKWRAPLYGDADGIERDDFLRIAITL